MDLRLFVVLGPALIALSWAIYNVGRVLYSQYQKTVTQ